MNNILPLAVLGGSLGPGELILIFIVALMLFGSKNLPRIARTLGKTMEAFRKSLREVSDEIMHVETKPLPGAPDTTRKSSEGESQDTDHDEAG